ncbi:MAG: T9SS type A sorting domain-containing protein [Calditrichaeota bacterium]|nr:T9SS type A sorting domain-containing protein [Calditrichota bacterium]
MRYDVPQAGKVTVTIFNLLGQRVETLFDGRQLAGSYTIAWDAANLPSGVYLCRMDASGFMQTRKMVLLK